MKNSIAMWNYQSRKEKVDDLYSQRMNSLKLKKGA